MIKFKPYKPQHLLALQVQTEQLATQAVLLKTGWPFEYAKGIALTAFKGPQVVACAGLLPSYSEPDTAFAWASLSANLRHGMVTVFRKMEQVIALAPYPVVRLQVDCHFDAAATMAEMLGAEIEDPTPRAGPMGTPVHNYRIRKGD